ncbi:MAG: hypothetical protein R2837_09615 [Aliarcobacter sp.]
MYIELENKKDGKQIVVSHASMNVWEFVEDENKSDIVEEYALWNRKVLNLIHQF